MVYGWMKIGFWLFFPRTPSAAEDVGSCGDRHVGRADRRQFWGLVVLVDVDIYELGVASEFGLNSMFPFPPAALIAGGAVGLLFAVFLILLLVYRMKKKDEGSYDLGKKPIYKKAPTNEFYA